GAVSGRRSAQSRLWFVRTGVRRPALARAVGGGARGGASRGSRRQSTSPRRSEAGEQADLSPADSPCSVAARHTSCYTPNSLSISRHQGERNMSSPHAAALYPCLTLAAETAADLMTDNPVSIRADATLAESI